MLHLVAERYDSPMQVIEYDHWGAERMAQMEHYHFPGDGMEYGLLSPERIAQLDRYYRSIWRASSYCDSMDDRKRSTAVEDADTDQEAINEVLLRFRDETKSEMAEMMSDMAEMKAQLSVIISILQDTNYGEEATPISPTLRAANEVDDLAGRFPTTIHGSYIDFDLVEEESIQLKKIIVAPSAHNMFDEMPSPLPSELMVEDVSSVLGKMIAQNNASKVVDEMPEPIIEEKMVSIEALNVVHSLFDNSPTMSPIHSDGDFNGKKDSLPPYPYIIEAGSSVNGSSWISGLLIGSSKVSTQNLNSEDGVLGVSVAESPSLSNRGFNPQVFDPGTLDFSKQQNNESKLNANESLHCINSVLSQAASSPQTDANLHHDFDYYSGSETTTVSLEDEVLVENAVPSSEELPDFKYYVSPESTIKDSLLDAVSKLHEVLLSDGLMGCEITVQSSIIKVNEQNRAHGDDIFDMYLFVYEPPMLNFVNPINGLHKAWGTGATSRTVVNLGPIVMRNDAQLMFDKMTPAFRTNVINGQLMEPYTRGGGKCFLSEDKGIAPETFVDGLKGVDGLLMFIFDPGISSWHLIWCVPLKSSEMFISGCQWPRMSYDIQDALSYSYSGEVASPFFGKVHGAGPASIYGRKGVDFSLRHDQSAVASKNWYSCIVLNHFPMITSASLDIFLFRNDSMELGENFVKFTFERVESKLLRKFLRCWSISLDKLTSELDLVNCFGSSIGLLSPMRANFAWDPGIYAIFDYILEDKDVFEWVGKDIILHIGNIPLRMSIKYNNSSHTHSLTNCSGRSFIEKCFELMVVNGESITEDNEMPKEFMVLLGCFGSAVVDRFFLIDKGGITWIEFLRGYNKIYGRVVSSAPFNNLFKVYGIAYQKAGLPAKLHFDYSTQDDVKVNGGLLATDLKWFLWLCWIMSNDFWRLIQSTSRTSCVIPDVDHLVLMAAEPRAESGSKLVSWDSRIVGLDVELPIAKIDMWGLKTLPHLADTFAHSVSTRQSLLTTGECNLKDFSVPMHDISLKVINTSSILTCGISWAISLILRNIKTDELSKACFGTDVEETRENLLYQSSVEGYNGPLLMLIAASESNDNSKIWIIGIITQQCFENREIQDCLSFGLENFIWDPGLWGILHHSGYILTTLFKFGCIASMISFKKMLNTIKLMQPWVCDWDSRKPVNIAAVIGRMNFKEIFFVCTPAFVISTP